MRIVLTKSKATINSLNMSLETLLRWNSTITMPMSMFQALNYHFININCKFMRKKYQLFCMNSVITWSIHGPFFNFNNLENLTWIHRFNMSYLPIIYFLQSITCLIKISMNSLFPFFRNHRFGIWEWQKSKAISETQFGIVCMCVFRTCWTKEKISLLA